MVNAHVAYIAANTLIWRKKKKDLLSHYKIRNSVALVLISLDQFYTLVPRTALPRTPKASREKTTGRPKKRTRPTKRLPNLQSSTNKRTTCRVNDKTFTLCMDH